MGCLWAWTTTDVQVTSLLLSPGANCESLAGHGVGTRDLRPSVQTVHAGLVSEQKASLLALKKAFPLERRH